ncbi:hypothetical protein ABZ896_23045 [Streptomyces sp. NPDC047072]|uniref:hypothetical protein n=1 Tax=Streptomyces sp. NPDC047072 TaxID=3154809 RepID=UPI0034058407
MSALLTPGTTIARPELHALLGGQPQGRISPSKTTPVISLFTTPGAHDSQHDGWTGAHFHFQGEGQGGREQLIKRGNRALAEHERSKRSLRLFVAAPGGLFRYLGAYRVDPDIPYVQVSLPVVGDPNQPPRSGYVFRLLPESGTPAPHGVPTAPRLNAEPVIRERDIALPFRPQPGAEHGRKLTTIEVAADRLLKDYGDHLRQLGRDVRRYHVTPARELLPLPVDLFDLTANELIACSGSVARTHMLAAFGELIDMRRFFNPTPRRVMLVPSEPRPDLAGLCAANDITLVWPDGPRTFHRSDPGDTTH